LADSFINRYDWTYTIDVEGTKWKDIWGVRGVREGEIMEWLSEISHMQMTAACCIGNAYHTINVSYMLALIMETYDGDERDAMFSELADFICENSEYYASFESFKTFELYYGIHLREDGNVIICIDDAGNKSDKYYDKLWKKDQNEFWREVKRDWYIRHPGETQVYGHSFETRKEGIPFEKRCEYLAWMLSVASPGWSIAQMRAELRDDNSGVFEIIDKYDYYHPMIK
jgi:hypothetical protein